MNLKLLLCVILRIKHLILFLFMWVMAGLKGIAKKVAQWILVLLSFIIPVCFEELGKIIHIDLAILTFLGWYVLISLIINEYRSILENLVEAGFDVPQILVKGLEVASQNIESIVENNE
ncbi:MAG TPA: holin [Catenibacterium sp.]|nr:holin [Catenibacterium sp.]